MFENRAISLGARALRVILACFLAAITFTATHAQQLSGVENSDNRVTTVSNTEPLVPIFQPKNLDAGKVRLGRIMFFDQRLSGDGTRSCNNCHQLDRGGADTVPLSLGANGFKTRRNTPTIFNSAANPFYSWDGHIVSFTRQIEQQITIAGTMGGRWADIIERLRRDSHLTEMFQDIYRDGITRATIVDATSEFVRSLVTANTPFDRFLAGEENALTLTQRRGHQLFVSLGCIACHQGRNIGGNIFQRIGIFEDYYGDGLADMSDTGRYEITGREKDRLVFRVPSLRNVAQTAPYFHDGSVDTLEKAVVLMARYQMGRDLDEDEVGNIVAFLHSLSAEPPQTAQRPIQGPVQGRVQ